jgi:hypothetical protein
MNMAAFSAFDPFASQIQQQQKRKQVTQVPPTSTLMDMKALGLIPTAQPPKGTWLGQETR